MEAVRKMGLGKSGMKNMSLRMGGYKKVDNPDKIMFDNGKTSMAIKGNNLYVIENNTNRLSHTAIYVMPNLYIELGRDVRQLKQCINETRAPIVLKVTMNRNGLELISVVRMGTGNVKSTTVAYLYCRSGIMEKLVFNKEVLGDKQYRRYCKLSKWHQASLMVYEVLDVQRIKSTISTMLNYVPVEDIEVIDNRQDKEIIIQIKNSVKFVFRLVGHEEEPFKCDKFLLTSINKEDN